jgi:hypothetical protein
MIASDPTGSTAGPGAVGQLFSSRLEGADLFIGLMAGWREPLPDILSVTQIKGPCGDILLDPMLGAVA